MVVGVNVVLTVVGFLFVVAVHTILAVVALRFFRVQLATRWAPFLYAVFIIPIIYVPTTIVLAGVLSAGGATIDTGALLAVVFFLPLALGLSIDVFWLPAPDEVDIPAEYE